MQRVLDVDPVHTLLHDSDVLYVRLSQDGKYVATGSYRFARISMYAQVRRYTHWIAALPISLEIIMFRVFALALMGNILPLLVAIVLSE